MKPEPPFYPIAFEQFRKTVVRIQQTVGARYRREVLAGGVISYELRQIPTSLGWARFGFEIDGSCWLHAGIVPEK